MATRRRDSIPGREKRPSTAPTISSPGPRLTPKTSASTTPIHPKIASAAASPDVSRQPHARRPLPSAALIPAVSRTTPLERKSPPIPQKTTTTTTLQRPAHVSTLPSPRPSAPSRKPAPPQRSAPDREKSAKAPVKDAGKLRPPPLSRSGPAPNRVGPNAKKQGGEKSAAAMKGHVNQAAPKKVELEKAPQVKPLTQEFFLSENEELTFRDHETGVDDSEPAGLETYSIEQFEAENFKEPDIVIAEHKEAPAGSEKQESEDITFVEQLNIGSNEIDSSNSAAYDTKSVVEEEETAAASGSIDAEAQETEQREAVDEKTQDDEEKSEDTAQEQGTAAEEKKQESDNAENEVEEKKEELDNTRTAAPEQGTAEEKKQESDNVVEEKKEESDNTCTAAPEQGTAEEKKQESDNVVEEKKEEPNNTCTAAPENAVEENMQESDNATAEHAVEETKKQDHQLDNTRADHGVEETKKQDPQLDNAAPKWTSAAPMPRSAQGKPGSAVSNDVIEETVVKLRERKSKVRALAGAFESVIALQDNNKR